MSHPYQTYFGFPGSDLNLDCGLRDHVITRFTSEGFWLYQRARYFSSTSLEPLKACKKFKFGPKFCWGENICRPTEFKEFAVEVATILYHTWKRKELVEYDPTELSLSSQKKHFFLWQVEEKVKVQENVGILGCCCIHGVNHTILSFIWGKSPNHPRC